MLTNKCPRSRPFISSADELVIILGASGTPPGPKEEVGVGMRQDRCGRRSALAWQRLAVVVVGVEGGEWDVVHTNSSYANVRSHTVT